MNIQNSYIFTYVDTGLGECAGAPPYRDILPVIVPGVVDVEFRQESPGVGVNGEDPGGVPLVVVGVKDAGVDPTGGQPRGLRNPVISDVPDIDGLAKDRRCQKCSSLTYEYYFSVNVDNNLAASILSKYNVCSL